MDFIWMNLQVHRTIVPTIVFVLDEGDDCVIHQPERTGVCSET